MKLILSAFFVLLHTFMSSQTAILQDDLQHLASDQWKGELVYRDYQDNQERRVPIELVAEKTNHRTYVFSYHYPSEPKADNKVEFKVNRSYTKLSGNPIISRKELPNGAVEIVTRRKGKDNKKKAMFYYIYVFGPDVFSLTTEVEYVDGGPLLIRSKYRFTK